MQEFKVETSALPAQYGLHAAAAVNAVTKSGTNVLHGGAFEFVRDSVVERRPTRLPPSGRMASAAATDSTATSSAARWVDRSCRGRLFYFARLPGHADQRDADR